MRCVKVRVVFKEGPAGAKGWEVQEVGNPQGQPSDAPPSVSPCGSPWDVGNCSRVIFQALVLTPEQTGALPGSSPSTHVGGVSAGRVWERHPVLKRRGLLQLWALEGPSLPSKEGKMHV